MNKEGPHLSRNGGKEEEERAPSGQHKHVRVGSFVRSLCPMELVAAAHACAQTRVCASEICSDLRCGWKLGHECELLLSCRASCHEVRN